MRNLHDAFLNSKSCVRFLMLVTILCTPAALTPLSASTAPPLTIKVVNNSGREIRYFYLSPADNDTWGADQLNGSSINSGATRTLDVSWDQSTVKLIAEDQDGCFLYKTVDASGNPVWTIDSDAARNCGS